MTSRASRATAAKARRDWATSTFTIVDTAGLEEGDVESLAGRMRAQTETALIDSDAIYSYRRARRM